MPDESKPSLEERIAAYEKDTYGMVDSSLLLRDLIAAYRERGERLEMVRRILQGELGNRLNYYLEIGNNELLVSDKDLKQLLEASGGHNA